MKSQTLLIGLGILAVVASGCATPRTKWSDKNMRVMIDPTAIDQHDYFKLQKSLVQTDKFTVVDRGQAMDALMKEQERLHRTQEDRFEDKQKWAHWGKMYGVGSVIVPHTECSKVNSGGFGHPGARLKCYQYLQFVDTNTGEVMLMVDSLAYGDRIEGIWWAEAHKPEWDEVVEKLVDAYPKYFQEHKLNDRLIKYMDDSEQNAKEHRLPKPEQKTVAEQPIARNNPVVETKQEVVEAEPKVVLNPEQEKSLSQEYAKAEKNLKILQPETK